MIPKIIHQTWKTDALPPDWAAFVRSWQRHHPDWEHRLWTDADNRRLVADYYSELLPVFDAYPYAIQRADAARYLILHTFGGVYVDMDMECLRPIDDLLVGQRALVIREPAAHAHDIGRGPYLSNAFLAAVPAHALMSDLVQALGRPARTAVTHRDVLEITGPGLVDRVFHSAPRLDVEILDRRVFFPFAHGASELETMRSGGSGAQSLKLSCILSGAYAVHHWANSWKSLQGDELVNPDPHRVAGFQFYPRYDSFGHDLRNAGRNVAELAEACRACDAAVAFNTDGFLKSRLRPRWAWQHHLDQAANEGLYVKRQALRGPLWRLLGLGR